MRVHWHVLCSTPPLLRQYRSPCLWNGAAHSGMSLPTSINLIKATPDRHAHKPTHCRQFLTEIPFPHVKLQLTIIIQKYRMNVTPLSIPAFLLSSFLSDFKLTGILPQPSEDSVYRPVSLNPTQCFVLHLSVTRIQFNVSLLRTFETYAPHLSRLSFSNKFYCHIIQFVVSPCFLLPLPIMAISVFNHPELLNWSQLPVRWASAFRYTRNSLKNSSWSGERYENQQLWLLPGWFLGIPGTPLLRRIEKILNFMPLCSIEGSISKN